MSPSPPRFGLWTLTFLVVANMVGAGVFTTSGFTLSDLGTPSRVVFAWLIGGVVALAGAVSYGRLVRAMPESGGEYLFLSRAAHPVLGFVAGWVSLIAGFTGAIAFAASAFERYVIPEGSRPSWLPVDVLAVAIVILAGLFHGLRPRVGAVVQNVAVVSKLGLLAVFLGLAVFVPGERWQGTALAEHSVETGSLVVAFASTLVWISLSYSGFNAAVYVASEAHEARRTVPRALVLGTAIVMAVYLLLNWVFVFGPSPEQAAGAPDIAAVAAAWIGGPPVAIFVRAIIAVALVTSVSSMLMAGPRVYAKMAEDGFLPRFLILEEDRPRAALAAVVAQVVLAILLIVVSTLQGLLSYLGLTLSLSSALSVGCLFLPSVRRTPLWHRSLVIPLIYMVATVTAATIMTIGDPRQLLGTALTFAVGVGAYLAVTAAKR